MEYYSTKDHTLKKSFSDAVLDGLAPDGGLYQPRTIPKLSSAVLDNLPQLSLEEIATEVLVPYLIPDFTRSEVEQIASKTCSFPIPLAEIEPGIFVLELFHGRTLAFKDFAAGFMAQVMASLIRKRGEELTILVATSGDTGGAVAAAFHNIPGIKVVVLYPNGRVSPIQEKQLTTLNGNIAAFAVAGSFDDCQALVKQAFSDKGLRSKLNLSSANSINIARLLPQSVYYFFAARALNGREFECAVPSGNFGNLTAGLIARRMGLKISRFIAAMNRNDIFSQYLQSGEYHPRESIHTVSNAMDVGSPSNFDRILDLFESSHDSIKGAIAGASFSDEATLGAVREVFERRSYLFDPHSAVGYLALKKLGAKTHPGVVLATAHPAKFQDLVESALGQKILQPPELLALEKLNPTITKLPKDYSELKKQLTALQS